MEDTEIHAKLKELSLCFAEVNNKFNGLMMMREQSDQDLRARIQALNSNQEAVKKVLEKLKQGFFLMVFLIEELKKEGDDVTDILKVLMMTQEEDSVNKDLGFSGVAAQSSSAVTDDLELGLSTNIEGLAEEMRALMMSQTASEGASERLLGWLRELGPLLDSNQEEEERDSNKGLMG